MDEPCRSEPVRQTGPLTVVAIVLSLALLGLAAGGASAHNKSRLDGKVERALTHAKNAKHGSKEYVYWKGQYWRWVNVRKWSRIAHRISAAGKAWLRRTASCESGGNPRAVGGGGAYRGKYQFSYSTWASIGGRGDPAQKLEHEQDARAYWLYRRDGPRHWPVCG